MSGERPCLLRGARAIPPSRTDPELLCAQKLLVAKTRDPRSCGVGFVTEELARSGFRIIGSSFLSPPSPSPWWLPGTSVGLMCRVLAGVDVLPLSIERAKKHASSSDLPHLDYVVGSAYSLPFESSSLTGVVSSDVLEHLDDLRSCFSEIARVLKPGGVFVFDTINRTSFSYFVCYLLPQPILRILPPNAHAWQLFISPAEVRRGLEEVGLAVGEEDNIRGMMPTLTIPSPGNWGTKWAWLGPWRQTAIVKGSYAWYAWKPL